jgi:hypothetical protein
MALVTSLEPSNKERQTVHRPTRCLYCIVEGEGGVRYVQLDTVGSDQRQFTDKVSQSIQFDRQAASQLVALFRQAFPDLA